MNHKLIPIDIEKLKESAKKTSTNGDRARRKLAILTRDNFKCVICNRTDNLTIAHTVPDYMYKCSRKYKTNESITLCIDCHNETEGSTMLSCLKVNFIPVKLEN